MIYLGLMQIEEIDFLVTHVAETSTGFYRKLGFSEAELIENKIWKSPQEVILNSVPMQCRVNSKANYFGLKRTLEQLKAEVCRFFRESFIDTELYTVNK